MLFVGGTSDVHHIKTWEFTDSGLALELAPAKGAAEPIVMKVLSVDQREMSVLVRGVDRSWKHQALLHKEADVLKLTEIAERVAREAGW